MGVCLFVSVCVRIVIRWSRTTDDPKTSPDLHGATKTSEGWT